jgi:hypothetical protein
MTKANTMPSFCSGYQAMAVKEKDYIMISFNLPLTFFSEPKIPKRAGFLIPFTFCEGNAASCLPGEILSQVRDLLVQG